MREGGGGVGEEGGGEKGEGKNGKLEGGGEGKREWEAVEAGGEVEGGIEWAWKRELGEG